MRSIGLDLIRTIAIVLVLLAHTVSVIYEYFSGIWEFIFNVFNSLAGYYGVLIFFILSGFLIGRIFISTFVKTEHSKVDTKLSILDFWTRRWLRTLPNYYLFLIIHIILGNLFAPFTTSSVISSIFFMQNLAWQNASFFSVSWSLAVEEWFYLLLPIVFIISKRVLNNNKTAFLNTIIALILIPCISKLIYSVNNDSAVNRHFQYLYSIVIHRLDAIGWGILLALMWSTDLIKSILIKYRIYIFLCGAVGSLALLLFAVNTIIIPVQNVWDVYLFLTLSPAFIILMFPLCIELKPINTYASKVIVFISLISYSLYLSHFPVIRILDYCASKSFFNPILSNKIVLFIFYHLFSIIVSAFVYKYFEKPFMKMRNKINWKINDEPGKKRIKYSLLFNHNKKIR